MATSFRMTSFASREAMTTAEPPEPYEAFMINVLFHQRILWGTSARRRGFFSVFGVFCGLLN